MGLIHIMERSSDSEVRRFEEGLKMAKEGIMDACEVFEDMKAQFGERGGYGNRGGSYGNRGGYGSRGGYGQREDWDEGMEWRRGRDSMGRYR